MAGWRSKKLGDGVKAFTPTGEIQDAFMRLTLAQARGGHYSYDAAVFSEYNSTTGEITVYFTPTTEPLAKMFQATPCEKPIPKGDFALSVGDARAWEIHFPGYLEQRKMDREE